MSRFREILFRGPYTKPPDDRRDWRYRGSYRIFRPSERPRAEVDIWETEKDIVIIDQNGEDSEIYERKEFFRQIQDWDKGALWCIHRILDSPFQRLVARVNTWRNRHAAK